MYDIKTFDTTVLKAFQRFSELPSNYEAALELANTMLDLSITQRVQLQALLTIAAFKSSSIFNRVDAELELRKVA